MHGYERVLTLKVGTRLGKVWPMRTGGEKVSEGRGGEEHALSNSVWGSVCARVTPSCTC